MALLRALDPAATARVRVSFDFPVAYTDTSLCPLQSFKVAYGTVQGGPYPYIYDTDVENPADPMVTRVEIDVAPGTYYFVVYARDDHGNLSAASSEYGPVVADGNVDNSDAREVIDVDSGDTFPLTLTSNKRYRVTENITVASGNVFQLPANATDIEIYAETTTKTITWGDSGPGLIVRGNGGVGYGTNIVLSGTLKFQHGGYLPDTGEVVAVARQTAGAFTGFEWDGITIDLGDAAQAYPNGTLCCALLDDVTSNSSMEVHDCTIVMRGRGSQGFIGYFSAGVAAAKQTRCYENSVTFRDADTSSYVRFCGNGLFLEVYGNTFHAQDYNVTDSDIIWIDSSGKTLAHGNAFTGTSVSGWRALLCGEQSTNMFFLYNTLSLTVTGAKQVTMARIRYGATKIAVGHNTAAVTGGGAASWGAHFIGETNEAGTANIVHLYGNVSSGWDSAIFNQDTIYDVYSWDESHVGTTYGYNLAPSSQTAAHDLTFIDCEIEGGTNDLRFNDAGAGPLQFPGCTDTGANALTISNPASLVAGTDYFTDATTPAASGSKPGLAKTPNAPTNLAVVEIA